jgi:hypothetical protein
VTRRLDLIFPLGGATFFTLLVSFYSTEILLLCENYLLPIISGQNKQIVILKNGYALQKLSCYRPKVADIKQQISK